MPHHTWFLLPTQQSFMLFQLHQILQLIVQAKWSRGAALHRFIFTRVPESRAASPSKEPASRKRQLEYGTSEDGSNKRASPAAQSPPQAKAQATAPVDPAILQKLRKSNDVRLAAQIHHL